MTITECAIYYVCRSGVVQVPSHVRLSRCCKRWIWKQRLLDSHLQPGDRHNPSLTIPSHWQFNSVCLPYFSMSTLLLEQCGQEARSKVWLYFRTEKSFFFKGRKSLSSLLCFVFNSVVSVNETKMRMKKIKQAFMKTRSKKEKEITNWIQNKNEKNWCIMK